MSGGGACVGRPRSVQSAADIDCLFDKQRFLCLLVGHVHVYLQDALNKSSSSLPIFFFGWRWRGLLITDLYRDASGLGFGLGFDFCNRVVDGGMIEKCLLFLNFAANFESSASSQDESAAHRERRRRSRRLRSRVPRARRR